MSTPLKSEGLGDLLFAIATPKLDEIIRQLDEAEERDKDAYLYDPIWFHLRDALVEIRESINQVKL